MWISGNVTLKHDKSAGKRLVIVTDLQEHKSAGLPKGHEVNAELVDPKSDLRSKAEQVLANGGEVNLGLMRVMNGGGVYKIPARIDLACDAGTHEAMWQKICEKLGEEPKEAYSVVFRDWGAPGTYGVCDGGGAGRGERKPIDEFDFLLKHCLAENLGEIGLVVHSDNHEESRVKYELPMTFCPFYDSNAKGCGPMSMYADNSSEWLNNHIVEEWAKARGSVPAATVRASISLAKLPDKLIFNGDEVENVKIAFEWQSASVECLVMSFLDFYNLEGRFRFLDLESRNGQGLNRRIGVILRAGDRLFMIFYDGDGRFDPNCPMIPITNETIQFCGNDKFAAVIEMIQGYSSQISNIREYLGRYVGY